MKNSHHILLKYIQAALCKLESALEIKVLFLWSII